MTNKPVSIGIISGLLKPKYKVISALATDDKYMMPPKKDVFIDLNTMILSGSNYKKYLISLPFAQDVEKDIIYSVLMIVKHWKDYFKQWDTRIFLIMNDFEMFMLAEAEYLRSYLFTHINKFEQDFMQQYVYYWTESIKRIEIVLKYIPNVYLIRCNRFDSYVIPNVIDDYTKNEKHRIIISGSSLMTNYVFMPNTTMLFSKYSRSGMSQINDPAMMVRYLTKIDEPIIDTFCQNKVFFNIMNGIVGDYYRGIAGITNVGISGLALDLLRAVEKKEIPNQPESIESVLPAINQNLHDYLRKNYPLIDIETHSKLIPQSMIEKAKSTMVDLYDIDGLRNLNIDGLNLLELL